MFRFCFLPIVICRCSVTRMSCGQNQMFRCPSESDCGHSDDLVKAILKIKPMIHFENIWGLTREPHSQIFRCNFVNANNWAHILHMQITAVAHGST